MSEFNYTYNNNEQANNGEAYNGFSTDGGNAPKEPKKHTGRKVIAFIMAMAVVSAGSIGLYRNLDGKLFNKNEFVEELDDNKAKDAKLALNFSNLEALCFDCHNKEHFTGRQNVRRQNRRWHFENGQLVMNESPLVVEK